MSANANSITVTVCAGRNIGKSGSKELERLFTNFNVHVNIISYSAKIDTYVVIQLDNVKFRTSIALKSVDPTWNEECEFVFKNKFAILTLIVYNKTTFFDEFIGQIRIPLEEICELYDTRPRSCWYPLKGKSGKQDEHKYIGELSIRIEFVCKKNLEVPVNDRFDSLSLSSQKTNNLRGLKMAVKKAFGNGFFIRQIFYGAMVRIGRRRLLSNPTSLYSNLEEVSNVVSDISSKVVPKSSTLSSFNRASSYDAEITKEKVVLSNNLPIIKPDLVPDNEISNATTEIEANNDFAEELLSAPIKDNYWKRMSSFGKAGGVNPDSTFELMSKVELLDTVKKQRLEVSRCLKRIRDLEDYIDQLTLRVIDSRPDLLLGPFSRASSARYPVYKS